MLKCWKTVKLCSKSPRDVSTLLLLPNEAELIYHRDVHVHHGILCGATPMFLLIS
jgi:hypothetical protein